MKKKGALRVRDAAALERRVTQPEQQQRRSRTDASVGKDKILEKAVDLRQTRLPKPPLKPNGPTRRR